jgi:glycerol-3-phosphate dehydrogenase
MAGLLQRVGRGYPWLPQPLLRALAQRHGANLYAVLAGADGIAALGADFGAGLHAREVDYFMDQEWAMTAEDVLWRRTQYGLRLTPVQQQAVAAHVAGRAS